ncbi:hypothetical protein EP51_39465 (plasmid) [Rhodococcus opacus]|uniref:N6 adenine-specific DNA methyltransferase N-terminal domain-containing protein n=1 Tax=Rhodococcus opacus TaxID=37919 RepID=A0A076EYR5_RHOOP|nr:hypothetical protein EP51_39465 [Rhodococcus opacus]
MKTNATLIWNIANLLRGPYQPNQYGDVILPFTILRRLDAILAPTDDGFSGRHFDSARLWAEGQGQPPRNRPRWFTSIDRRRRFG